MSQVTINLKSGPVTMDRAKAEEMLRRCVANVEDRNQRADWAEQREHDAGKAAALRAEAAKFGEAIPAFRAALEG